MISYVKILTFFYENTLSSDEESKTPLQFFYHQPHFRVGPRVATGITQNDARICYEVARYFLESKPKVDKIFDQK